ncbi:stage III sporulation protein AG [Lihuaxuella thermophila]|uniref:Stage III sporulation protein AG n=1 Tax=Lihuaxuella thermophila TaxID=1173111 RepID=A0A1H8EVW0_9BACL|nr:stage III sporulation protein AG [Lihuaxuella thermophila]SEN22858.1 stage III sporulation protein AG [Lihuaxuella thermophila]
MWKQWLTRFEEKMGGNEKQKNRFRLILLLGFAGAGVMLFSSFQAKQVGISEDAPPPPEQEAKATSASYDKIKTMQDYEREYEAQLEEVLSKIVGVDDVSVIVNLDSTEEEVVQMDIRESEQVTTEVDKTGGNRRISQNTHDKKTAYYRSEDGEKPVVVKQLKPKVRGVLVVARGVENLQVKAIVIEAVQRTLDVPVHRISVLPKG